MARGDNLKKSYGERTKQKNVTRTHMLSPGDLELIEFGAEYLGCSRSEFVRTSIRTFAAHLEAIRKGRG